MLRKGLIFIFITLVGYSFAQSKKRTFRQRELGFFGGASYYIGDINPRGHFTANHPAAGLFFRYTTNYRFSFRFGINAGSLSGDDAKSAEADQQERNLNFTTRLYDMHSLAEFNFVEYRIGHDRYKFTVFIFAGLAGFYFNPQSNSGEYLRDLRTEGQSSSYPKFQFSVPFGVGVKWNMGEKWGLGVEWGPRNTFTDYIDDIKGGYPELPSNGETVNPNKTAGSMRGNPSTKDWYFFYGVTLSIKLREPNRPCHKGF